MIFGIIDNRKLKFMCVCAYMHNEILNLEKIEREGKGERVIKDEDNFVTNTLLSIKSIIEENKYTYEDMSILSNRIPRIRFFYDAIDPIIRKHVNIGEEWIPAIVILSVLQEFTLRGYEIFKYIPFIEAIDYFITEKDLKASPYMKVAGDIHDGMVALKFNKNKKRG